MSRISRQIWDIFQKSQIQDEIPNFGIMVHFRLWSTIFAPLRAFNEGVTSDNESGGHGAKCPFNFQMAPLNVLFWIVRGPEEDFFRWNGPFQSKSKINTGGYTEIAFQKFLCNKCTIKIILWFFYEQIEG